jgi:hypothetical protein
MFTWKHFRLKTATLGIDSTAEKAKAVAVPAGSPIEVLGCSKDDDSLVNVRWQGKILTMFVLDLEQRGEEIHPDRRILQIRRDGESTSV